MISLCPACHARIRRTRAAVRLMPALLVELWRELHPNGHEQTMLNFSPPPSSTDNLALFPRVSCRIRPNEAAVDDPNA